MLTTNDVNWSDLPPNAQGEVFTLARRKRAVGLIEEKPGLFEFADTEECACRVIQGGGEGMATFTGSGDIAAGLCAAAKAAHLSAPDYNRQLPSPRLVTEQSPAVDQALFKKAGNVLQDELSHLAGRLKQYDRRVKKCLRLVLSETLHEKKIQNSNGLSVTSKRCSSGFMAEILVEAEGQIESGWEWRETRAQVDLCLDRWSLALVEDTVRMLGARPLPTKNYAALLHPRVGASLLSILAEALSAQNVQWGKSFFRGFMNRPVASTTVTLLDDPTLAKGLMSDTIDDEGVPQQFLPLIENGVLVNFFHDTRTASHAKRPSNGRAFKPSLAQAPRPGPTNFFLKEGRTSLEDLLRLDKIVFVVREVMGLHMVDPISGEFSLGAAGFLYKNGAFMQAVRGVTISGTLLDLLKNIIAVGDAVSWYGPVGAPYVAVSSLQVAGV